MADNAEEFELEAIECLFHRGYMYKEIVDLLSADLCIETSFSTLKRRLKTLNLARKNVDYDFDSVRQAVRELKDAPDSIVGIVLFGTPFSSMVSLYHVQLLKSIKEKLIHTALNLGKRTG